MREDEEEYIRNAVLELFNGGAAGGGRASSIGCRLR